MTTDMLQDRAATIGGKLAAKLQAGAVPTNEEVAFFDKCMLALTDRVPAHDMRVLALQLHAQIDAAKAKRAAWLKGRDEALKAADVRKATKAAKHVMSRKMFSAIVAEVKARKAAYTPPVGTTKQGLEFVVELPLEWQDDKAVA